MFTKQRKSLPFTKKFTTSDDFKVRGANEMKFLTEELTARDQQDYVMCEDQGLVLV